MRTNKIERKRAEWISAAIDRMIADPDAQPDQFDPEDSGLLDTARQLAQMPSMLGPVDPTLEQLVRRQVQLGAVSAGRRPRLRLGWAIGGLAAVLLAVLLLTPLGQTAVASFMAVFNLGRTQVSITPVTAPSALTATVEARGQTIRQSLTLEEAQGQVSFAIPQPAYLPPDYSLRQVSGVSYPDLPAWVPQPFFVELAYEDHQGHRCMLRVYPIALGDRATISRLNLEASPIHDVQDVDINGQPGVLLRLGDEQAGTGWQEVVWEQTDRILALSAGGLTEDELLHIARSVR